MHKDYKRFLTMRHRVMNAIRIELEKDNSCKSYEGTFEILVSYPDYFERTYENKQDEPNIYIIRLHCYVLGPGRHYEWIGATFKEALDKCEEDIKEWTVSDEE